MSLEDTLDSQEETSLLPVEQTLYDKIGPLTRMRIAATSVNPLLLFAFPYTYHSFCSLLKQSRSLDELYTHHELRYQDPSSSDFALRAQRRKYFSQIKNALEESPSFSEKEEQASLYDELGFIQRVKMIYAHTPLYGIPYMLFFGESKINKVLKECPTIRSFQDEMYLLKSKNSIAKTFMPRTRHLIPYLAKKQQTD